MKPGLIIATIFVAVVLLLREWITRPEVYRQCRSPTTDGLVMQVHRVRTYPYIEGVDVIVSIRDSEGAQIFSRVISNEDLWSDVERQYPNVQCLPNKFIVGPGWWDGEKDTNFVILKGDPAANSPQSSNKSFKPKPLRGSA